METENKELKEISSKSDETEQKMWDIIQGVPGLNSVYGSVRLVVYISKGNKEEAWKSLKGVVKGVVQSAAIAGSVFVGPLLAAPVGVGVAAGAITAIITESIQGVAHVVIFVVENAGELKKNSPDEKEKLIYSQVKEIPGIGAAYSTARSPVYAAKGENTEVKVSGINAASGTVDTAINVGINLLPTLNNEIKGVIQSISKSIIQLLSQKVLEDVAKKRMSLEEGVNLIKSVEENCDSVDIITVENGSNLAFIESLANESPSEQNLKSPENILSEKDNVETNNEHKNDTAIRNALKRLAKLLKRENGPKLLPNEIETLDQTLEPNKESDDENNKRVSIVLITVENRDINYNSDSESMQTEKVEVADWDVDEEDRKCEPSQSNDRDDLGNQVIKDGLLKRILKVMKGQRKPKLNQNLQKEKGLNESTDEEK